MHSTIWDTYVYVRVDKMMINAIFAVIYMYTYMQGEMKEFHMARTNNQIKQKISIIHIQHNVVCIEQS